MRYLIIVLSFIILFGNTAFANDAGEALLRSLAASPKAGNIERLIERYKENNGTIPVIVHMKRSTDVEQNPDLTDEASKRRLRRSIRRKRGDVLTAFSKGNLRKYRNFNYLPFFAAEVTPEALKKLVDHKLVEFVEEDAPMQIHTLQGGAQINATVVRDNAYDGNGVGICIVDSGVNYRHTALGGTGGNTMAQNPKVIGGYDEYNGDADPIDDNGHGTQVAGIVLGDVEPSGNYNGGVAPGAKMYIVKATDNTGNTNFSTIAKAWERCIDKKNDDPTHPVKVITMSIGSTNGYDTPCDSNWFAPSSLKVAAAAVRDAGMSLFVSAGNEGRCDQLCYPACLSTTVSVGAVNDGDHSAAGFCVSQDSCVQQTTSTCSGSTFFWATAVPRYLDAPAVYSNTSPDLDLLAPADETATTTSSGGFTNSFRGTSAACPYAAASAVVMQSAAFASQGQFLATDTLVQKLKDAGDPVYDDKATTVYATPRVNLSNVDVDDDGLPMGWESYHFQTIDRDGFSDFDGDGLLDGEEFAYMTDPTLQDTDGDGVSDYVEVQNNSDPLDMNDTPLLPAAAVPALSALGMVVGFLGLIFLSRGGSARRMRAGR